MNDFDIYLEVVLVLRSCQPLRHIRHLGTVASIGLPNPITTLTRVV